MQVFGCDPGLSGAIALMDSERGAVQVWDIPTFTVTRNRKNRREIDIPGLVEIFDTHPNVRELYVELVGAMRQRPGQQDSGRAQQGLSSAFAFGKGYGIILGVAGACQLSVTRVSPIKWKKKLALIGESKDGSRARASELFPQQAGLWRSNAKSGRAEACLIGFYGMHHGVQAKRDDDEFPEQ